MATVSALLNKFCDRVLINREASYVGSSTPAARQYVSLLEFICSELLKRGDWITLKRVYTFTTQTGVSNYQNPGDFWRPLRGTQYSVNNQMPLAGPISNGEMALQTYGITASGPYAKFQFNGAQGYVFNTSPYSQTSAGYFQISPAGTNNTDQNVIAYISKNTVWPTNWLASTGYLAGVKVTGINNIYICTTAGTSGTTRPSVLTGTVVDGTVTWTVYNETYPISADTDICLFDDELVVEGMRWAYWRAKKQDYGQEKSDWDDSVKVGLGRQNGAILVNAAGMDSAELPNVPDGSWSVS